MTYRMLGISCAVLLLNGCLSISTHKVEPSGESAKTGESCELIEQPVCPVVEASTGLATIGQVEYVDVLPTGVRHKARIDTGAETTSIDSRDIVLFERDGRQWVRFLVLDRVSKQPTEFKLPVERMVTIKRHGAKSVKRPVVALELAIGSLRDRIEVSLANREKFTYPVLIGRNFLDGRAQVDVSRKFTALEY